MRLLLGGLVLVALFLAAVLWQRHWTTAARSERLAARGSGTTAAEIPGEGWSRVIVGRPGGGEPYPAKTGADSSRRSSLDSAIAPSQEGRAISAPAPVTTPPLVPANEWVVQPGQSLSRICQEHYGSARLELVSAVARHNQLETPDLLREGQKLDLPPLDQLLPKR